MIFSPRLEDPDAVFSFFFSVRDLLTQVSEKEMKNDAPDDDDHGFVCSKEHLHYLFFSQRNEGGKQNENWMALPAMNRRQ